MSIQILNKDIFTYEKFIDMIKHTKLDKPKIVKKLTYNLN
jgi:hypothetical protein